MDLTSHKVLNVTAQAEIKDEIARAWGIRQSLTHSPAPNPVSLHREHLESLRTHQYVVAEKTDGVRYLLVISRFKSGKPYAVLVDRAFSMFQVQLYAPSYIYKGSVFDGEMVLDKKAKSRVFHVFDAVVVGGKSVRRKNFIERYHIFNALFLPAGEAHTDIKKLHKTAAKGKIVSIPETSKRLPLTFRCKVFMPFNLFGSLTRDVQNLTHASDGFIFTPVNCEILKNTHRTMFKWKFEPTIDLEICAQADGTLELCCQDGAHTAKLGVAFPEYTFILNKPATVSFQPLCRFIVEVSLKVQDSKTIECVFHRQRADKLQPNHVGTIKHIIQEVVENISLEELVKLSQGIY